MGACKYICVMALSFPPSRTSERAGKKRWETVRNYSRSDLLCSICAQGAISANDGVSRAEAAVLGVERRKEMCLC